MRSVTAFEARMLRGTRALMNPPDPEKARKFLKASQPAPPCFSADALHLLKDTIAKGVTLLIAKESWRRERYLRGETPRTGRLWERSEPSDLGLTFTRHTPALLCWLAAADPKAALPPIHEALPVGDLFLAFLVYRHFRDTELQPALRNGLAFRRNALCLLFYQEDFPKGNAGVTDWRIWADGLGATVIESFERELAQRWIALERDKRFINDPARMIALAATQDAVFTAWFEAIERAGRRDLARFILRVGSGILGGTAAPTAEQWLGSLPRQGTIAERTNLDRAGLVFLRQWSRLETWTQEAWTIGYLDEGYAAAQLWKAAWEAFEGDELSARARSVLREIEPFKPGDAP